MFTTKKEVETIEKEIITGIFCDRCRKDLGDDVDQLKGGWISMSFPWGSDYYDSDWDDPQVGQFVFCDACLDRLLPMDI